MTDDRKPTTAATESEEDEIRARAYELFLEGNCEPGHADEDWFRAEAEIRKRRAKPPSPSTPKRHRGETRRKE